MLLGQDRNFDLANYHLYNGFSFLNNKIDLDIAAAGVQTYLNPILDTFFYYLNTHLNGYLFGFLMGCIHGINIVLLYKIINQVFILPRFKNYRKLIIVILAAGCFTPNFLAGLGSSMGDNSTSIFVLGALFLLLRNWKSLANNSYRIAASILSAGFLLGVASALKLTNLPFAISMGLSLFIYKSNLRCRLRICCYLLLGALAGILIFGGFWYLKMWEIFGNPIFPYLSNIFVNPNSVYINPTTDWLPRGFFENLFWPYIFSFNYHRVGEGNFRQILWPIFYTFLFLSAFYFFIKSTSNTKKTYRTVDDTKLLFLVVYVTISYFIWMRVFSVLRYMVSIELLLPLIIFILWISLCKNNIFLIKRLLFLSIVLTLFGGFSTWGHSRWTSPAFRSQLPQDINKNSSVILVGSTPLTWMVTQFPSSIAFFRFGPPFKLDQNIRNRIALRNSPTYVMFGGFYNWRVDNVHSWNTIVSRLGMTKSKQSCASLGNFISRIKFRGKVEQLFESEDACKLSILDRDYIDPNLGNNFFITEAKTEIAKYNYTFDDSSCKIYEANIGSQNWRYIWCEVLMR